MELIMEKPQATKIPAIVQDKTFNAENEKYRAIRNRLRVLQQRLQIVQTKAGLRSVGGDDDAITSRVERILEGKLEEPLTGESFGELQTEAGALRAEISAMKAACMRQKDKVDQIASNLSHKVSLAIADEHKASVAELVKAIEALQAASQRVAGFNRAMAEAGYSPCLPSFRVPPARFPLEPSYRLDSFIHRALEYCE